jgi:hypothetical protein
MKVKKRPIVQKKSRSVAQQKWVYADFLARVDKMNDRERFDTMVDAGIYTKAGKLTSRYGG